jgi:DNA polymerase III subunit delta
VSDELEPVYLICGSDRPKVLRAVGRLRARVAAAGGSEELYDALDTEPRAVAAACEQLGLFAGDRLVLVSGVESWTAEAVRLLEPYLAAPAPATTLALVAGPTLRKDHRLLKALDGKRRLAFELPSERELPGHLRKEAQRLGAHLDGEALRLLIDIAGPDAIALETELDKLATYAAGEPIDAATVEQLAFRGDGVSAFAVTDAVAGREREPVFRFLERAFDAGEKPHALLPMIARQLELLRQARRELEAGGSAGTLARRLGIHEFRAKKAMSAAAAWSERDAALALCRLADADHAMKGGRRIDPELALERALAESL